MLMLNNYLKTKFGMGQDFHFSILKNFALKIMYIVALTFKR